jgi:S-adenosylmethionine-diacylgycerolhomoserine-N-methlytransferase
MTFMTAEPATAIERYYRLHARIYDVTRWSFLFGRRTLLKGITCSGDSPPMRILEVGCGTGKNLTALCRRFPKAFITGLDLSAAMLGVANKKIARFGGRVRLVHQRYDGPVAGGEPFDLVLFSYSLSMFNPGFEAAIDAAHADLAESGQIAVVDFHDSRFRFFERWMGVNHVRMDGQLQPKLRARFVPQMDEVRHAYGGLWRYLLFIGRRLP